MRDWKLEAFTKIAYRLGLTPLDRNPTLEELALAAEFWNLMLEKEFCRSVGEPKHG